MTRLSAATLAALLLVAGPARAANPLAEKYLTEGKLAEGEKTLSKHLVDHPRDDQARFGLGMIQVGRAVERLGRSLHRYGFRTKTCLLPMPADLHRLLPENARAERLSNAAFRAIVQTLIDDLKKAEQTLAGVKDDKVKLPLPVGRIRLDFFGQGKPISLADLIAHVGLKAESRAAQKVVICFDRGDVAWLRGYCHFLAACGELTLATDTRGPFKAVAHRFFRNPDSMLRAQLNAEERRIAVAGPTHTQGLNLAPLLALPVVEPKRTAAALRHLEGMMAMGQEMWSYILAETDDDNEWVPNPKQTGAMGIPVGWQMVTLWTIVLSEVTSVLQGKKLAPVGLDGAGINVRKLLLHPPRVIEPIAWLLAPANYPFVEKGTVTELANPRRLQDLGTVFPGWRFLSYSFWFN